jgi:hypothetical protein
MKRTRLILIAVCVVMAGTLAIAIYRGREPRYQGRTLTGWMEIIRLGNGSESEMQAAINAVQQIGTNAIPWLVKWSVAEDPKVKAAVILWVNLHPSWHLHLQSAEEKQKAARLGMLILAEKSRPACPGLIRLTYDKNPDIRYNALLCLMTVRADKETLLPVLARACPFNQRFRHFSQNVRGV